MKKILTIDNKVINSQPARYNSIDYVKFIMAFAVIAIHTRPLVNCTNNAVIEIYNNLVQMAVPFFFLASGYLLSKKIKMQDDNKEIDILKKHLYKIIKLYIVWMVVYTPLAIYGYVLDNTGLLKCILLYIRGVVFLGEQYNSLHLWYLLSTIYALIFIIILKKMKCNQRIMVTISIIFMFISVSLDWLSETDIILPYGMQIVQKLLLYTIVNGRIFRSMIYIPMGMYLAYNRLPIGANVVLLIGGFACNYFIDDIVLSGCLIVITSVGLFGIVEAVRLADSRIYGILRYMSTYMYLIHMYIWTFYYLIIKRYNMYIDFRIPECREKMQCAIDYYKENNLKQYAECLHNYGTSCIFIKDYENAQKYLSLSVDILNKICANQIYYPLNSLAILYSYNECDYNRATKTILEALKCNIDESFCKLALHNNLFNISISMKDYESAYKEKNVLENIITTECSNIADIKNQRPDIQHQLRQFYYNCTLLFKSENNLSAALKYFKCADKCSKYDSNIIYAIKRNIADLNKKNKSSKFLDKIKNKHKPAPTEIELYIYERDLYLCEIMFWG